MNLDDRTCVTILGVLSVLTGAFETLFYFSFYYGVLPPEAYHYYVYMLVPVVFFAAGAAILLFRKTLGLRRAAAIVSMAIGFYYLRNGPFVGLDSIKFLIATLFALVGVTLIVFGILLFFNKTKDATLISYMSFLVVGYNVMQYIMTSWTMSFWDFIWTILIWYISETLLFLFFAYVLLRPGIKSTSLVTVMTDNARRVMDTEYSAPDSYIMRADLLVMSSMMGPMEARTEDRLIMEREVVLRGSQGKRVLKLRRWRDDDCLRITVASTSGSLNGYAFSAKYMIPMDGSFEDCTSVRMYDENGFHTEISVVDPPISYKDSLEAASKSPENGATTESA